jgi:hypothetical protein
MAHAKRAVEPYIVPLEHEERSAYDTLRIGQREAAPAEH